MAGNISHLNKPGVSHLTGYEKLPNQITSHQHEARTTSLLVDSALSVEAIPIAIQPASTDNTIMFPSSCGAINFTNEQARDSVLPALEYAKLVS